MDRGYEAKDADEHDVVCKSWRKMICSFQRAGVTSYIKRKMRRRGRRFGKKLVRMDVE